MNKKGFALLELLIVLLVLGILAYFLYPREVNDIENTKDNYNEGLELSFINEVNSILLTSKSQFLTDSLTGISTLCYDSETKPLDLNSDDKKYYLNLNENGEVINLIVKNDKFEITILDNNVISVSDIGSSTSNKKYKSKLIDENNEVEIPKCINE